MFQKSAYIWPPIAMAITLALTSFLASASKQHSGAKKVMVGYNCQGNDMYVPLAAIKHRIGLVDKDSDLTLILNAACRRPASMNREAYVKTLLIDIFITERGISSKDVERYAEERTSPYTYILLFLPMAAYLALIFCMKGLNSLLKLLAIAFGLVAAPALVSHIIDWNIAAEMGINKEMVYATLGAIVGAYWWVVRGKPD